MKNNNKWIHEYFECDEQMYISDFPVTDVDNISERFSDRNLWVYGPHHPCCAIEQCVGCLFGCYLA